MTEQTEQYARSGYSAYCAAVGNKAWNGDPLKTFDELDATRQGGWVAFARSVERNVILDKSGAAEAAGIGQVAA